ncbi:succinyl-diaminopimelate desuccinylase [Caminibacter pacificus]|uniref:Succinyl-diaminopimelate desuccinylase n=1 Tax=Caminibacter pacificus TaxID=1424653 RepID=A0AAJ4REI9_9BACT|nr:succinyl-diaminopimelate desuccinylase [Caminibacter pacificus]NPA87366.1 succinyl-diaminopimelate desuccinylase [Campylobacterota bacterium]QCI28157.1 succinyl-diaminopimelate desuccinylase [Caminibacter pacificus]ROR41131.1 hypothetical protein EDC58_0615 [Caminibacter pacificus]
MRKVYELKKGMKIISDGEILEFEEIRGDKAIFYNDWGIEFEFPDYLDIDEIGEIYDETNRSEDSLTPSLF